MAKHTPLAKKIKEAEDKIAKEYSIKNKMSLPRIEKIVVNSGTGDRLRDKGVRAKMIDEFASITGQKPKVQAARISVAGFSVREGMPVGLTATLRRDKMHNFLEKVISVVLPRLRDFRGVSNRSFDKWGNYTFGIAEHTVFPEIDLGQVDRPHGLEVTIVIKNSDPEKSRKFLELIGMPFEKND